MANEEKKPTRMGRTDWECERLKKRQRRVRQPEPEVVRPPTNVRLSTLDWGGDPERTDHHHPFLGL